MLELRNVCKTFNKGTVNEKVAIKDLSLTVRDGDFITVIGGNGAGKSTMLNLISGVHTVDDGYIILDGVDITHMSEHKRAKHLGRVFQDPLFGTAANMEIEENLAIAYRRGERKTLKWAVSQSDREFFRSQVARLGLGMEDRMTTKVGLLSGGQRQALTLLMATMKRPSLLLLDEHTAALDPATASKVLKLTEEMTSESHLTTIMITHNMNDAIRYGNRLIMMHDGNVIYDVSGEEKKSLTVDDLLKKFETRVGSKLGNDRMLLS